MGTIAKNILEAPLHTVSLNGNVLDRCSPFADVSNRKKYKINIISRKTNHLTRPDASHNIHSRILEGVLGPYAVCLLIIQPCCQPGADPDISQPSIVSIYLCLNNGEELGNRRALFLAR